MPADEAKKWVAKLISFSAVIRSARDSIYPGWRDVPMWYLICTMDRAIRVEIQEDMVRRCREAGANITTRKCEAAHSPMMTKSNETIAFIEDAVKAFGARERL